MNLLKKLERRMMMLPEYEPNTIMCVYCQNWHEATPKAIADHIFSCDKRPEAKMSIKMHMLEEAGDFLLKVIHTLVTTLVELEGMRSMSWEIYRTAQERWEITKNVSLEDIKEEMLDGKENSTSS